MELTLLLLRARSRMLRCCAGPTTSLRGSASPRPTASRIFLFPLNHSPARPRCPTARAVRPAVGTKPTRSGFERRTTFEGVDSGPPAQASTGCSTLPQHESDRPHPAAPTDTSSGAPPPPPLPFPPCRSRAPLTAAPPVRGRGPTGKTNTGITSSARSLPCRRWDHLDASAREAALRVTPPGLPRSARPAGSLPTSGTEEQPSSTWPPASLVASFSCGAAGLQLGLARPPSSIHPMSPGLGRLTEVRADPYRATPATLALRTMTPTGPRAPSPPWGSDASGSGCSTD